MNTVVVETGRQPTNAKLLKLISALMMHGFPQFGRENLQELKDTDLIIAKSLYS